MGPSALDRPGPQSTLLGRGAKEGRLDDRQTECIRQQCASTQHSICVEVRLQDGDARRRQKDANNDRW